MLSELQQAIEAIKAGDKKTGYRLLAAVIKADPRGKNAETAWLWMSQVVNDPRRKLQCLETVLRINPNNAAARKGLEVLQRRYGSEKTEKAKEDMSPPASTAKATDSLSTEQTMTQLPVHERPKEGREGVRFDLTAIESTQWLGVAGSLVLVLGVFVPIVRVPLIGSLNYFQNGRGDGVFLVLLAIIVMVLVAFRSYRWVWVPALATMGLLVGALINLLRIIGQLESVAQDAADQGGLFGGLTTLLLESFQLEWGWVVLFIGVALVLLVPLSATSRQSSGIPALAGAGIAIMIILVMLISERTIGSDLDASGSSESLPRQVTPVGENVEYPSGALRVLQVHDPASFLIVEEFSLDHKPVAPVSGTRFVAVEFEFTCSATESAVCETVPEASLDLRLEDDRRIDDDWGIFDVPELGDEDVASGNTVKGWRAFRVPDNGTPTEVIINPFGGTPLRAALPPPEDGYRVPQLWRELDSEMQIQLLPELRLALREAGLSSGYVVHMRDADSRILSVEICEDTEYSFDDDAIIENHRQIILDTLRAASNYLTEGEDLALRFDECDSIPTFEFYVLFLNRDVLQWRSRNMNDSQILNAAHVSR